MYRQYRVRESIRARVGDVLVEPERPDARDEEAPDRPEWADRGRLRCLPVPFFCFLLPLLTSVKPSSASWCSRVASACCARCV